MHWLAKYWHIVVTPKTKDEIDAERWLIVWSLRGDQYNTCQCRTFYRHYILIASFIAQFVCGILFALSAVSKPFELTVFRSETPNRDLYLSVPGGLAVALAAAFVGPASERKGPRWSMAMGSLFVVIGLAIVQISLWTTAVAPLVLGAIALGTGFGYIMVSSVSTVQKWYPDLRGSSMGICMFGFGTGQMAWNGLFTFVQNHLEDAALHSIFLFVLLAAIPLLGYCIIAMRTPPATFHVNGHNMHGIPADRVAGEEHIQDDYLNFGMTLVNYTAMTKPRSDKAIEGTERYYYEQVKALTLLQCIFSSDFFCLALAFAANTSIALLYVEIAAPSKNELISSWYNITLKEAHSFLIHAESVGVTGRLVCPILSDILIRVLYLNPAFGRKIVFLCLLFTPVVALPILQEDVNYYESFKGVIYVVKFCAGGGFSVIGCFLTDLYGVYNMGTMYGLILTSWSGGMLIVSLVFSGAKEDFVGQVELMWVLAIVGFALMIFVRTDNIDRFYYGYQFSICGKVIVQIPYPSRAVDHRRSTESVESSLSPVAGIDMVHSRHDDPFFVVNSDSETNMVV
ncbi:major Facilitator Superfamily (MFS) [Thraustotheca clavata]|uniref:Major Facilitator Superfamily (MFS) n=1 Tax=Thraustotheca clavata TaxID=74557 RepID=A0A1V9ZCU7_9STRA|nr:major Facilitator Superfamily (MFS) [Thraustotheca clavata]